MGRTVTEKVCCVQRFLHYGRYGFTECLLNESLLDIWFHWKPFEPNGKSSFLLGHSITCAVTNNVGNKVARADIAMIKVVAPNMSCKVVDWAIQAHGGAGVSQDFWLAEAYAHQRTVRLVDGPDEVHRNAIAKIELAKRAAVRKSLTLG